MKLTKQKLKEIIKEELLKEYVDLDAPVMDIHDHVARFKENLYHFKYNFRGGSTDTDSINNKRYKALVKLENNVEKTFNKLMNDYKKVWKIK